MNDRENAAIAVSTIAKAAYDDCAAWCEHLAAEAEAGMPHLSARELALFQISMRDVAKGFRLKGAALRDHLPLMVSGAAGRA